MVQRVLKEISVHRGILDSEAQMDRKETKEQLVSQVLGSQDHQEKRVSKASQDSQEYQERRVLGVMRVCQASQDCKESRETKDLLGTQVSQVDQARRVSLGCQDLQENLVMMVGLVNLACKGLLVFLEKREILD